MLFVMGKHCISLIFLYQCDICVFETECNIIFALFSAEENGYGCQWMHSKMWSMANLYWMSMDAQQNVVHGKLKLKYFGIS